LTACCEADTNFADESVCLLADKARNETVVIHRSQEALNWRALYWRENSDLPVEAILQEYLQFPCEYILLVLPFVSHCCKLCHVLASTNADGSSPEACVDIRAM
jgi:hypothetical protein